jgi:hypothetical protein
MVPGTVTEYYTRRVRNPSHNGAKQISIHNVLVKLLMESDSRIIGNKRCGCEQ